jgi:hypothetical protein
MAVTCIRCHESLLGQRVAEPPDPELWRTLAAPRTRGTGATRRWRDPFGVVGTIGVGLIGIVWLLSYVNEIRWTLPMLVGGLCVVIVGVALAVRGSGYEGLGIVALVLGAIVGIGLVTRILFAVGPAARINDPSPPRSESTFQEPVPPPPGHGFVIDDSAGPGVHAYRGRLQGESTDQVITELLGPTPPARVLDEVAEIERYYVEAMGQAGWIEVGNSSRGTDSTITFQDFTSSKEIRISISLEPVLVGQEMRAAVHLRIQML